MVRGQRKSSTEQDSVSSAPSRRSGRARPKITYNDGEGAQNPPEILVEADEEKPKRGRKKVSGSKKSRRSMKNVAEKAGDEEGAEESTSNGNDEACLDEAEKAEKVHDESEETAPEEVNEAKINSKLETITEEEKPSDKLQDDTESQSQTAEVGSPDAAAKDEELPEFEEEEKEMNQNEDFEIVQKVDVPLTEEFEEVQKPSPDDEDTKESEQSNETNDKHTPDETENAEEKLPEFDDDEQDPDMLQLDANADEDMELNKTVETTKEDTKKTNDSEDTKREERKRRWKDDEKEKSPTAKRRQSIKKSDTREPSPPPGEPSVIVHIKNLVRPFTLQQLKDFLNVHGDYSDFWIDKIKSNCFVKYKEVDSAINCRKLIHGKKWPSSNPKSLRVVYSSTEQLDAARAGTLNSSTENVRREKRRSVSRSPTRGGMRSEREFEKDKKVASKASSDESEEDETETGGILLDDLFKKTKTTPSIYWLPLTDVEIKERDQAREERKKMREQRRKASEERKLKEREEKTKSKTEKSGKNRSKSSRRSRTNSKKRSRSRS